MSTFKLPLSICRAIEQRIASFWWQNGDAKRGLHWKSWELLKTRKDAGGMGFKDLITFNRAMLGKQAWRLATSPQALWSRVLKGLYFPDGDIWQASKGNRPSWGWQSILMDTNVESRCAPKNSLLPLEYLPERPPDEGKPERELVSLVLWNIWKARNNRIFRAQEPRPADLLVRGGLRKGKI